MWTSGTGIPCSQSRHVPNHVRNDRVVVAAAIVGTGGGVWLGGLATSAASWRMGELAHGPLTRREDAGDQRYTGHTPMGISETHFGRK